MVYSGLLKGASPSLLSVAWGVLFWLASADGVVADSAVHPVKDTAAELISLFRQHTLSPRSAASALSADATVEQHGREWEVFSKQRAVRCVFRAADKDGASDVVDVHVGLEAGLLLDDLVGVFGPWKQVYSSKTSSVKFRFQDAGFLVETIVFAKLFTPKPTPRSPVLSLALRRIEKNR